MNPWDRDWGTTADAPPAAPAKPAVPEGQKPWERDWGKSAKPASAPPSADLSDASGMQRGKIPEESAEAGAKDTFTHFLDKESAKPRIDPTTGQPRPPTFTETLEGARLKQSLFSNLAEGFARKGREFTPKLPEWLGGVNLDTMAKKLREGSATPSERFAYNEMLNDLVGGYKTSLQEDKHGFMETVEGTVKAAIDNPGGFAGQLVSGFIQDPEMIALGGLGTGGKLAGMVKKYKTAAEAAGITAEATAGGAVMSAAGQYAEMGKIDSGRMMAEAAQIGLPMGMIHVVKGRGKVGEEPKTGDKSDPAASPPGAKIATEEDFADAPAFGKFLRAEVDAHVGLLEKYPEGHAHPEAPEGSRLPQWGTEHLARAVKGTEERIAAREAKDLIKASDTEKFANADLLKRLNSDLESFKTELKFRERTDWMPTITGLGMTAAALAMANPDVRDKAGTGAIIAAAFIGMPGKAIGPMLRASSYGSRVLERLAERAPGKSEFGKQELQSEINRQDIPKPEREVLEKVLGQLPGEKVSATDLMHHFQLETQNFELKPETTNRYATYGLLNIGRSIGRQDVRPQTDVWKLPNTWNIPGRGHFESMGPNQYGHTRSFTAEGVRHVVEMQSDLQQHLTPLSEGQIKSNELEVKTISEGIVKLKGVETILDQASGALRPALEMWREVRGSLGWTIDYAVGNWVREHTPTMADINLRRLDGNGVIQSIEGGRKAVEAIYKERRSYFDPKTKTFHSILDHEITSHAIVSDSFPSDEHESWRVKLTLGPEAGGEATHQVIELADRGSVIMSLTNDGWAHRNMTSMLKGVIEHVTQRRDEISATLGDEPAKAATREKLRPIGEKMWPRRLIQEEIARAGREGQERVRFASADTMATVEGWPRRTAEWKNARKTIRAGMEEGPERTALDEELAKPTDSFISPGHQSIHARYADEIAKYLKSLGAKDIVDQHGHTWHEVPVKGFVPGAEGGAYPPRMFGRSDPRYLARLAALGIGASAGAYFNPDNKLLGMLEGTLLGAGGILAASKFHETLRDVQREGIRINRIGDDRDELIQRMAIDTWQVQSAVERIVPKVAEREHLARWLLGDRSVPLNAAQQKALPLIKKWFNIPTVKGTTLKAAMARFVQQSAGMKDISSVMGAFGHAIARSVADTRMLDALEAQKDPAGNGLIASTRNPPQGYVHINHPLLQGYVVHPDIESSLKHLLDTPHPVAAKRIAMALVMGTKRALVSFSLFHATALSFAAQAASSNPVKFVKLYAQAVSPRIFGENIFLKELRERGHAGPLIDKAVKGGLNFSLGREQVGSEDVGNFYAGMHDIVKLADDVFPGLSMPVRKIIALNQKFDGFMWDRLHAGMKLSIFAEKYQQLIENNARAHAENPGKVKLIPEREAARIAATFSNSTFGGLNWRKVAESVRGKIGRDVALGVFSPSARKIAQVALFAPDWLVSTTLPWINAFGKGTGIKGILNAQTLADLNRQYLIRSGLFYLVAGDAINHAMSGHHLWDNKDPFVIEMDPQGERHMIFNKHFMEVIHALQHPAQSMLGKMSYPIKEGLNQLFGTEYLAPHKDARSGQVMAGPAMEGGRGAHALKGLNPISVQQGFGGGAGQGLAGFFGLPIYGKTKEQRRKESEDRRRKRTRERIDAYLSR